MIFRPISILLSMGCLFFVGCASTSLYSPSTGKKILFTQADAQNISYSGNGVTFHADMLLHSPATIAGGKSVAGVIGAGGAAATAMGFGVGGL